MFHRKPAFVSLKDVQINKNQITVKKSKALSKVNKLIKSAINWQEIPVNYNEKKLGIVDRIDFDAQTGDLISIGLSQGVVSGAILGKSEIKEKDIIGYSDKYNAVMLKDGASIYETKEGLAETAGKATSVVVHKVKKTSPKVINSMQEQSDKIHNMFHEFKEEVKRGMEDNEQE